MQPSGTNCPSSLRNVRALLGEPEQPQRLVILFYTLCLKNTWAIAANETLFETVPLLCQQYCSKAAVAG